MRETLRVPPFSEGEWTRIREHLGLPPRQAEIARHILCGRSDKQIADEMGISVATVRPHLGRLLGKFGLSDRVELPLYLLARLRDWMIA
jgi:DNA-binding NarL/FixJ family response regulator